MARKKQKLINYNTSGKTSTPSINDVEHGEIVVRWNTEEPQLLIKIDSGTTETFATFSDKNAVSGMIINAITAVTGNIEGLETSVRNLSSSTETFINTTVPNTYITSANAVNAIDVLNEDVTGRFNALDETFQTIEDAKSQYSALSGQIKTVSGNIITYINGKYATSSDTVSAINSVASDVSDVAGDVEELSGSVVSIKGSVSSLSGSVVSLSGNMVNYIDTQLSSVYHYKGSVNTTALLPSSNNEVGDVYNVVSGTGSIGDADYVPPGTNYAWTGSAWDALGGTIDLSTYATKNYVDGKITTVSGNVVTVQNQTLQVSGSLVTLSGKVVSDYYTKTQTDNTFLSKNDAQSTYVAKTDLQSTYWTSATTESKINSVSGNVTTLSSTTQTIETKVNNSISGITTSEVTAATNTTNTIYASGVKIKVDNSGRAVKFDFSELVIDCGDF